MHLLPAMYTTTGKKKGKQKWASAEAKQRAEKLQAEWQANLKKWGVTATKKSSKPTTLLSSGPKVPPGRETARIESRDTGWVPCVKTADQTYTGTKVKGIGTLHKSNGVPIFSDDEAKDIAKMRR